MRIVVIGAGFVGRPLCRMLKDAGQEVVPVTLSGGVGVDAADVSSRESMVALEGRIGEVDAVVHCASSGRGGDRAARYRAVHLEGCRNVVEVLQPGKVVSLIGPGGIGKTAVAAEAIWRIAPDNR